MIKLNANCILLLLVFLSCKSNPQLTDVEKSKIQNTLKKLVVIDQIAASPRSGKYEKYSREQWRKFQDSVFNDNRLIVGKLYKQYGFLGPNKVGEESSEDFWLLVQHFDKFPQYQKRVLRSMDKEAKKGNVSLMSYAYLYDRVNANSGKKQLFGTQVIYQDNGKAVVKNGLKDSANVDVTRKRYELEPLKEYLNFMTQRHFEMNKEFYLKKGIKFPQLY